MPNWCQNVAYINHENKELIEDLKSKLDEDKENFFKYILPRPADQEENWYEWNINNWGTKWDCSPYEYNINEDGALYVNMDTAWGPPVGIYEHLYSEGYDVEAFYNEEGMAFCGWYIDGEDNHYEYSNMSADEIEENLPTKLDEMFNISQYQRDREDEEDFEDEVEFESQDTDEEDGEEPNWELMYGFTEWFNKKDKPSYIGLYEVKTKEWPWPMKVDWDGKKWITNEKVTEWRGLATDPVQKEKDLEKALEELKEEFEKLMAEENE
jgi:hypothetical protein